MYNIEKIRHVSVAGGVSHELMTRSGAQLDDGLPGRRPTIAVIGEAIRLLYVNDHV
jgi:hypothetical protein